MLPTIQKKFFDITSAGFWYSAVVTVLGLLGAAGVAFGKPADVLAGEVLTAWEGGIWAFGGIIVASVIFPIWNARRDMKNIFRKTTTWIALFNLGFAALALTGIVIPAGTVEAIFAAVQVRDWMALGSLILLNIGNPLLRGLKSRGDTNVTKITTTTGETNPVDDPTESQRRRGY
jgi:hypothetical protein